jgi:hypothetical protein
MTTPGSYSAPQQYLDPQYPAQQYGQPHPGQQYGQPHPGQQYGQPHPGQQYGQPYAGEQYGQPHGYGGQPTPGAPAHLQYAQTHGPIGKVRSTGVAILLCIVTLGFYSIYYYFATHDEMKRHTGEGVGGLAGLLIAIFVGFVSPYLLSHEIGALYERRGQRKPVSAATGLWVFPGLFLLVGPIIWFVKTNGALNAYWRSVGAR